MNIRFCTYNCNSVRANFENVKNILSNCDIVFLQELLLCRSDLPILDELNNDFENIAFVQDRESDGIMEGRPTRGVAVLWRKSLSSYISPLLIDDSVIGIILSNVTSKVLLLNVYMPCDMQTLDALHNYRTMLAKLGVLMKEQNLNNVILTGDFNADPRKGRFWGELKVFMDSFSLFILDEQLPQDCFTYLCPAKSTTSWLDHVLCTHDLINCVTNMKIDYEGALYDHFPLYFNLLFDIEFAVKEEEEVGRKEYVNWNRLTEDDKRNIKVKIDMLLNEYELPDNELFVCSKLGCKNKKHRKLLDKLFKLMKTVLLQATEEYVIRVKDKYKIIPGWNDYLKDLYALARQYFLEWLRNGKPLNGIHISNMKQSRCKFKSALDQCRRDEEKIRNEKMVHNYRNKKYKDFWRDVNLNKKGPVITSAVIDGESDPQMVVDKFSVKYKSIFDRNNNGTSSIDISDSDQKQHDRELLRNISQSNVREAIKQLKCTIGDDMIHSNHLKFCSDRYIDILAKMLSSFLSHAYIPKDMIQGTITPTVKDRFGSLGDSGNYRPVMSSSVFLKVLEYCILFQIKPFIKLNDRQHGYREKYSTSTACFVLKETVYEYCNHNSRVYSCFLDFSKAFDNVNHKVLIDKLKDLGIPPLYIDLIKFWYSNQFARVRYNNIYSEEWKICNGVRQGGILSGLFFCIYVDSLIEKISNLGIGCRLGIHSSNIIAYADDIVLLAPSASSLQIMMNIVAGEALKLDLQFNVSKCRIMIFMFGKGMNIERQFLIGSQSVCHAQSIKYLGFYLTYNLCNVEDINVKRNKFYSEFNQILRKFHSVDRNIKLFLFKQFCLQIYGAELWFGDNKSKVALKQFAIGYHKAIKKLISLSYHESNHYACEQAELLIFEHYVNSLRIKFLFRLNFSPCLFVEKIMRYLLVSSVFVSEVNKFSSDMYQINDILENDLQAIVSRVAFVQNHERQMRGPVVDISSEE